jgi:KDO2-lipid IV(A) lauroyltransferase
LLRKNFEHYGTLVFELLHMYSPIPNHFRRYALKNSKVHGIENWKRAHDLGKGVLFVASHIGNWELMVAGGAMAGIPLTMVTKHLKPEWLHKKMEATRLSVQVRGAYEPRPLPVIMRALRNKESVGFVMDQYAGPPIGIPVPFFGVKVGTLAAVGTLATRTGAAIITVSSHRGSDGCIHINIQPMLELSSEVLKDDVQITALLARQVEGWVRQCPEQWLWIHRRFKNVVWSERMAYTPSNASRVDT